MAQSRSPRPMPEANFLSDEYQKNQIEDLSKGLCHELLDYATKTSQRKQYYQEMQEVLRQEMNDSSLISYIPPGADSNEKYEKSKILVAAYVIHKIEAAKKTTLKTITDGENSKDKILLQKLSVTYISILKHSEKLLEAISKKFDKKPNQHLLDIFSKYQKKLTDRKNYFDYAHDFQIYEAHFNAEKYKELDAKSLGLTGHGKTTTKPISRNLIEGLAGSDIRNPKYGEIEGSKKVYVIDAQNPKTVFKYGIDYHVGKINPHARIIFFENLEDARHFVNDQQNHPNHYDNIAGWSSHEKWKEDDLSKIHDALIKIGAYTTSFFETPHKKSKKHKKVIKPESKDAAAPAYVIGEKGERILERAPDFQFDPSAPSLEDSRKEQKGERETSLLPTDPDALIPSAPEQSVTENEFEPGLRQDPEEQSEPMTPGTERRLKSLFEIPKQKKFVIEPQPNQHSKAGKKTK